MTLPEEIDNRIRMLESVLEFNGELHSGGVRELLETLERIRDEEVVMVRDEPRLVSEFQICTCMTPSKQTTAGCPIHGVNFGRAVQ